ncbi:NRAMP family divalent metal transporter [Methylobacterium persicinum]|uniref:NRAMP (Natural resistance-associated macrophage protein)-like metal ion transporter n=1 Tax=Methylobacterium persicinum TaxID=374426 RepID=A0ABU0HVF2_9HYPH|nr:divalent metal cation transporter [Methylobacterium persicinum]MDQ0445466.1 NRAMP (natural resistance-associated macrophage protein)-like metal ion transporter [Methylobacterium persicinum]
MITGAADDDPSGIATYSQVGAQFGYGLAWTMLFSLPFMIVIQEISGRVGCVTGRGIAANLRRHYPVWFLRIIVTLLLVANVVNLGADLGAMGAALTLLLGGNSKLYTVGFGVLCVIAEIFIPYGPYAGLLKWLTLSLFAYVAVVFAVHVPWDDALFATLVPHIRFDTANATALVAVLGTTISPYLFFWQSALEAEDQNRRSGRPLCRTPEDAGPQFDRIRTDTVVGMGVSNVIAIFIIYATAATLHANGVTEIQTSAQAAEALRPIAGVFTFALFALGIVGTGLLAVPVLAGSAAYALSDAFQWTGGLDRQLRHAKAFYATLSVATLAGVALNFTALDPVKALYWAAVVNGILAAPVMVALMLVASNGRVMGRLKLSAPMRVSGWMATAIMTVASVAYFLL